MQSSINYTENNYPKAIAIAVSIIVVLLVLSLFYIVSKNTPPEEVGIGGITVNYGTTDNGMGTDYMSIEEPSVAPNSNNTPPDKVTPNEPENQLPTNQSSEKDIVTQENEDVVALNTKKNVTSSTDPSQKIEAKDAKPVINQNALYKGKKNNGTGLGDGNGNAPGNQGKPEGDPLSNNYDGTGSGNGGVALSLAGRKFISQPVIRDDGQKTGKIAVNITVDRNGVVIDAQAPARGSTLTDPVLCDKCEKAVLGARLNKLESAPEVQRGVVMFVFKVN